MVMQSGLWSLVLVNHFLGWRVPEIKPRPYKICASQLHASPRLMMVALQSCVVPSIKVAQTAWHEGVRGKRNLVILVPTEHHCWAFTVSMFSYRTPDVHELWMVREIWGVR